MKITSIFKKTAVFATAMLLILIMVVALVPFAASADDETPEPIYHKIEGETTFGETLSAMNISQSGKIKMMFYFTGLNEQLADGGQLNVTVAGTSKTYTVADLIEDEENGRWLVEVPVVAAQMTELISLQWTKDGEAGKIRSYSVRYYANKILEKAAEDTNSNYAKMANNVINMLNYGAMAQKLFGTNPDLLANAGLFTEVNPIENMSSENFYGATKNTAADSEHIQFLGTQSFLEETVNMRVYVKAPEGAEAFVNGKQISINTDKNGQQYVGIRGIPAHKLNTAYDVIIKYGEEEATAQVTAINYLLGIVDDYKTDIAQRDAAKALYLYYAWAKNFAGSITEDPADDFKPGAASGSCTHGRSHVFGDKVVCSDCGETVNIKLGLKVTLPEGVEKLQANKEYEIKFTLSAYGNVNLKALVVTPEAIGPSEDAKLDFEFVSADFNSNGVVSWDGAVGQNIVADTIVAANGEIATVTYKVTAPTCGNYKIVPTVHEAIDSDGKDIAEDITPAYAALTVDHTASDTWTHVLAPEGGKVTGELYEEKLCTVCKNAAETRKLYYYNSIDSIRVNGTVINPRGTDQTTKNQTAGVAGAPDSGYLTFTVSPENFIDANKNLLTFHDTDSFKTGGWFAVNGGVERYVIRINDGAWQTLTGTPGTINNAEEGIGLAIANNGNITDRDGAFKNANYQGLLTFSDLEAYANQTIKITLGAVPAANRGTDENPNVLITAVIENLFVECTHLNENAASIAATDDPTVFIKTCKCGNVSEISDVNEEGLKMFNADEIVYRGAGQGGSNYSITKMTENGLDFARFELTCEKQSVQEFLYYFANNNEGNATNLTYGLSDTFMVIYRANKAYPSDLTLYLNQSGWKSQVYPLKNDSQWHIAMYDLSALYDDTRGHLNTIRFDIFDAGNIEKGATIDIAYMGFFKSEDHALENYAKAAEKHEAIGKAANWALNLDSILVDGTNYKGKNPPVSGSTGQFGCIQVDLEGYTIATSKSSIIFRGWLVTPFGAEGIYYTITDADGNVSERKLYVKPGNAYSGILTNSTSYRYGSQRGNGSIFQSTNTAFDLSEYERQTVSIDVILVNNIGQEGTIMQIKNVAVPCTHKAADDAVWTLDPNDPMFEKADCLYCDEKAERYVSDTTNGLLLWTPNEIYSKSNSWSNGNVTINNDNGLPYVHYEYTGAQTTVNGECVANLYGNIADPLKVGKYAAILYRTTHTGSVEVYANSNADKVNGPNVNFGGNTNNLNEWTFRVKEFPANADTTKYDAQQQTAVRLDWFNYTVNNPLKTGDTVDIAFIAYFDSEAEAYAFFSKYVKAYGEESWCDHKYINTEWVSAEKIYKTTCTICGNVETKDMIYKSEAYSVGTVGSHGNFLTATTVTEGDETFVRYTPTKSEGDPYFYPWSGHTSHVTGQFMVIKYRVTNNGKDMNTSAYFAGSAASTKDYANGQNGDGSNRLVTNTTLYADGEWHYIIMTPNIGTNKDFGTNADGTYTWKWARMRLNAFAAFNGSCYFDIDEVAFADNIEAATYYIYKNDTTGKSLRYVVNLDNVNVTIDNASFMGDFKRGNNEPIVLDMSQKVLTTPTSLKIGGWVCVDGGVKAYKMRVTSVDGKAVDNPELVTFVTPGNRTAIYDAFKTSYTEDCAIGAGMNKTAVNLTAWAGKTVTFEIVAITNYGAEIVAVRCTNVVVPKVAAAE